MTSLPAALTSGVPSELLCGALRRVACGVVQQPSEQVSCSHVFALCTKRPPTEQVKVEVNKPASLDQSVSIEVKVQTLNAC